MTYASHILIVKSHKSEFRISKSSAVLRTPYGGHLTVETISKPVLSKKACPELAVALNKPKPCLPSVAGSFVALAKKDSEGGSAVEGVVEGSKDSNDQRPKTKDQTFSGPETCFEF
jgi:hypothetical protein